MNKEASMYRELSLYLRLRTHCTRGEVEQRSSCCSLHVEPVRLPPSPQLPCSPKPWAVRCTFEWRGCQRYRTDHS